MTFGDSTLHNLVAPEEPTGSGLQLGPYIEGLGKKHCFSFWLLFVFFFVFDSREMSARQDITLLMTGVDSSERKTQSRGQRGVLQINPLWFGKSFSKWQTRSLAVTLLPGSDSSRLKWSTCNELGYRILKAGGKFHSFRWGVFHLWNHRGKFVLEGILRRPCMSEIHKNSCEAMAQMLTIHLIQKKNQKKEAQHFDFITM